ncbi:DMT family transporter [Bacteroides xylanisolvens]|jgi:predicted permeases|uniref:DMT family transporter n=1 Tax=Bacteroides xylanisolvens TaxID=371601 RepID=A0A7J5QIK7_9BACE|nr:DMT family transporter [Bacteroides xylanisolvens]KAB6359645.1 DMT family transporter [Bacteroides xylanisolvens]KAB6363313.1 DMT family transporter [Bacteroides xylanisolvens]KAB6370466.1 DMT family transporter [Bacteroides xylanisolvens]KAB6379971.1 DMT family transporter [Bacteroides xylanisolvens]KAB6383686.1 DMT family transporter [Bacteroides xylanisolvens]
MNRIKGILYAAVSSSTFGLAPFFSLTLLLAGFSAFEVLSYRWGVATIALTLFGWCSGCSFRLEKKDFLVVLLLSLLRAVTSFSLLIAYQNIATGVASTIHFMYPLAVSLVMMYFFQEKKSLWVMFAVFMSLLGAALLSSGELEAKNGDTIVGLVAACVSVFSYAGYIVGVRMTRAVRINSTVLTCYVMGLGTVLYFIGALTTSGLRLVADGYTWLIILGLALPATAISNITLVRAIKYAGPTLTSILGAMEPLTAVVIGVFVFKELFTLNSAIGIILMAQL